MPPDRANSRLVGRAFVLSHEFGSKTQTEAPDYPGPKTRPTADSIRYKFRI